MTAAELRRLLELAANAIGGTLSEGDTKVRTGPTWDTWEWGGPMGINTAGSVTIHPQHDDGDSRRLQVKLRIIACFTDNSPPELGVSRECAIAVTPGAKWFSVALGGVGAQDECAAMRLAVLRAAASIGEAA